MSLTVQHSYVSGVADGANAMVMRPSDWGSVAGGAKATHVISGGVPGDVGLGNVENTALSTWGGSGNLTTTGPLALVVGGTLPASTLTFRATSGVGVGAEAIIFQVGNNGATEVLRVTASGLTMAKASAALQTDRIVFQTNEAGAGDFRIAMGSTLNPFGVRYDQVLTMGYNQLPGAGGKVLSAEHAIAWRMENYYTPSGVTQSTEVMLAYINRAGSVAFRPMFCYIDLTTDSCNLQWISDYWSWTTGAGVTQFLLTPGLLQLFASMTMQGETNNVPILKQKSAAAGYTSLVQLNGSDALVLGGLSVLTAGPFLQGGALALGTTSTDGVVLQNTTPTTAGVIVQQSPRLRFRSHVWNTTTPADNIDDWVIESAGVSQATPGSYLYFRSSKNGAGFTNPMVLGSGGDLTILAGLAIANGGSITFGSRGYLTGIADGQFMFRNTAATSGFGFDCNVDAVCKVRTRAMSAYAQVDALGYSVGGVAGASKAAGAVTSITVVNGIVTACS